MSGDDNNLFGILARLADPTAPGAEAADFDAFVASFADAIDGLWAGQTSEVSIVAGVDTYRLSAQTFRDATADLGSISFADYAMAHTAGWWTNKRMPAAVSNIQQAIVCRKGRSMMPSPTRLAVCPTWGYLTVEDIYTGARKGERRYVLSVLVGDVILDPSRRLRASQLQGRGVSRCPVSIRRRWSAASPVGPSPARPSATAF